jgi:hypothetical protein
MATPMTPAEFKLRYPQFATLDDAVIQLRLDDATLLMNEERWCDLYAMGQGLLAAHELTLAALNEQAGSTGGIANDVTSETAGNVSYTRSNDVVKATMESPYNATQYGQRWLFLARQVGTGAIAV